MTFLQELQLLTRESLHRSLQEYFSPLVAFARWSWALTRLPRALDAFAGSAIQVEKLKEQIRQIEQHQLQELEKRLAELGERLKQAEMLEEEIRRLDARISAEKPITGKGEIRDVAYEGGATAEYSRALLNELVLQRLNALNEMLASREFRKPVTSSEIDAVEELEGRAAHRPSENVAVVFSRKGQSRSSVQQLTRYLHRITQGKRPPRSDWDHLIAWTSAEQSYSKAEQLYKTALELFNTDSDKKQQTGTELTSQYARERERIIRAIAAMLTSKEGAKR